MKCQARLMVMTGLRTVNVKIKGAVTESTCMFHKQLKLYILTDYITKEGKTKK